MTEASGWMRSSQKRKCTLRVYQNAMQQNRGNTLRVYQDAMQQNRGNCYRNLLARNKSCVAKAVAREVCKTHFCFNKKMLYISTKVSTGSVY